MSTNAQRFPSAPLKQPPQSSDAAASSINEEDLRYAIDIGALGLIPWALTYLPHHFSTDPAEFHEELSDLAEDHPRLAVAAPRGHAKSTLLSLAFPLYRAAVHKEPYTLIISDSAAQAEDHLGNIFQELLENDQLVEVYPHLALPEAEHYRKQRVKRRASDFITLGNIKFLGKGAGAGLRGARHGKQRPSLIIVDDLENDENVETEKQREKLLNWFRKSLSNLPGSDGGQIIVIGTILHKESLLAHLLSDEGPSVYVKRTYRAVEDGKLLWPASWSAEALKAKREEIGSRAYASEYLNEPVDSDSTLWKEPWLNANRVKNHPELVRLAVAVDPSASGTGDACGIVAGGRCAKGHGYTLEDNTIQGSPATWARIAVDTYQRLGADYIIAEKNNGGEMIKQTIRSILKPGEAMPPVKLVWASRGKTVRADPVAALDENGKLHIVGSLPRLEDELTSWIPGMTSPNRLDAYVWLWSELLLTTAAALPARRSRVRSNSR